MLWFCMSAWIIKLISLIVRFKAHRYSLCVWFFQLNLFAAHKFPLLTIVRAIKLNKKKEAEIQFIHKLMDYRWAWLIFASLNFIIIIRGGGVGVRVWCFLLIFPCFPCLRWFFRINALLCSFIMDRNEAKYWMIELNYRKYPLNYKN